MSKYKAALGPQAAPHPYLPGLSRPAEGYYPGVVGSGPMADAVRQHAGQLAQEHHTGPSPVPGVDPFDSPQHLNYQPGLQPQHAVTLEMKSPHPENAMNRGVDGGVPAVNLQQLRADQAAAAFGVTAAPGAAAGLAGEPYCGDYRRAPINTDTPVGTTPRGAPGAAIHYDRDQPGQLQRPHGTVDAPGAAWATMPPGVEPGPAGGYPHGHHNY
jgi:hypothetical protein